MKTKNIAVMFCAPLSLYPEKPEDYSKSELINCPTCKMPMWFSEKKKEFKRISEDLFKEMLIECLICFKKRIENDLTIIKDANIINI